MAAACGDAGGQRIVSSAGGVLMATATHRGSGSGTVGGVGAVAQADGAARPGQGACWIWRSRWRLGGDCLADIGQLRATPAVYGPVASDPTVSRLIDRWRLMRPKALSGDWHLPGASDRARVWHLAGTEAPDHGIDEAAARS